MDAGYNDVPVYYCKDCHSLKIITDENLASGLWDGSYCGACGSTHIGSCSIEKWLKVEEMNNREV